MKQILLLVAFFSFSLVHAQKDASYSITIEERDYILKQVDASKLPAKVKESFLSAFSGAICELYNPWTGECDKWMDPDDPLPSTQGLKYQKERAETINNFAKAISQQKRGSCLLKLGSETFDLQNLYGQFNQSESTASSIKRMQIMIGKMAENMK